MPPLTEGTALYATPTLACADGSETAIWPAAFWLGALLFVGEAAPQPSVTMASASKMLSESSCENLTLSTKLLGVTLKSVSLLRIQNTSERSGGPSFES